MSGSECAAARFLQIGHSEADAALVAWGHYLGACRRPFGRQSWGLEVGGVLVAVVVAASPVSSKCRAGERGDLVEVARLCAAPGANQWTRVALRLFREVGPAAWGNRYGAVKGVIAYSEVGRHEGQVYRFDGWRCLGDQKGSGGGGRSPRKIPTAKRLWYWEVRC